MKQFARAMHSPIRGLRLQLWMVVGLLVLVASFCPAGEPSSVVGPGSGAAGSMSAVGSTMGDLTIIDARGKEIKLPGIPQRIVVAGKASFMVIDAVYLFPTAWARLATIGKEEQGTDAFLQAIDPGYASKTVLGREAGPEQIAAAKPDVVLLKKASAENLGKALEALGIPVVCVDFETPDQYDRDLAILGHLFGQEARANELGTLIHERLTRIEKVLAGLDEASKPSVLLIYYSVRDGTVAVNVPPKTWMQTLLVKMAGGRPVWEGAQLGQGWTKVGFEQIAAWDPDQVFVVSYFVDTAKVMAELAADKRWQALRAVGAKKIWAFPGDLISWDQPDPRWMLGVTWLATKIHPERFTGVDMTAEASDFFKTFYGLDSTVMKSVIIPKMHGDL